MATAMRLSSHCLRKHHRPSGSIDLLSATYSQITMSRSASPSTVRSLRTSLTERRKRLTLLARRGSGIQHRRVLMGRVTRLRVSLRRLGST